MSKIEMKGSLSVATIAEMRREYQISKRHDFVHHHIRRWWTRDITELGPVNTGRQLTDYRKVMNQCTLFYYTQQAKRPKPGWGTFEIPEQPGAAVYKAWYQAHDHQPNIDWDRYFAYPFQLSRPYSISNLVQLHQSICREATERHRRALEYEKGPWTLFTQSDNPRNYASFPLCSALLVVLDNDINPEHNPIPLDDYGRTQTVVLVRTGDEVDLSRPIDFTALAHKALPLARPDASTYDAIRVSIYDAVRFIAYLQKHEEEGNPEFYFNPRTDIEKNPPLVLADSSRQLWHPSSEDEYITEVLTAGKYTLTAHYVEWATDRVRRREAGDESWDDLERDTRYGHIRIGPVTLAGTV